MLSHRTERDYRQVVERWTRDGQPDPVTWVSERSSEATRRNARAGLVWHFRVNLGRTLDIPWVRPTHQPVRSAFSVAELAVLREQALEVHRRCRPVIDLLYSTGARLQEACGIALEDVKDTHIILRDTKRRPGGLQVHRAVPLGPVSQAAVIELSQLPPGKAEHTHRGMPAPRKRVGPVPPLGPQAVEGPERNRSATQRVGIEGWPDDSWR